MAAKLGAPVNQMEPPVELIVNGVNDALPRALSILSATGLRHTAASVANERPTLEHPGVFITVYERPNCNVLFDPVRDANPFFHYLESLWILAGRNDVAFLRAVLPGMARYTDDGETYHGAYGYRLRNWPTRAGLGGRIDQVFEAIELLRSKPTTRQVVMSIWDPTIDLGTSTKDMPCNDMIMLKVREGKLHLTVCNRSNDAILGAYGANAVQFSMLQMYMASALGLKVGRYTQVSDSMHVYEDDKYWQHYAARTADMYPAMGAAYFERRLPNDRNLFDEGRDRFDEELDEFFDSWAEGAVGEPISSRLAAEPASPAIRDAYRMYNAVMFNRAKEYRAAKIEVANMEAPDWRMACQEWLQRREEKRNAG